MLGKIHTFNSLVDLLVLQEGYFHVPISVLAPIKSDFVDVIRFKDDELEKNYKLDFSNTKYDFLNELEPQPNVDVRFTKGRGKRRGSFHVTDESKLKRNNSFIQIDFSADKPERILSDVIEHEVSHFIQKLIKKYNMEKKGYGSLGGMPSKRFLRGIELDKNKISDHTKIPSEIYPDVLSSIRELQSIFNKQKEIESKKDFFLKFLNSLKDKKPIGNIAPDVLNKIKELSEPLYKQILKKIYIAFVE